jgi:hypothetical protein
MILIGAINCPWVVRHLDDGYAGLNLNLQVIANCFERNATKGQQRLGTILDREIPTNHSIKFALHEVRQPMLGHEDKAQSEHNESASFAKKLGPKAWSTDVRSHVSFRG